MIISATSRTRLTDAALRDAEIQAAWNAGHGSAAQVDPTSSPAIAEAVRWQRRTRYNPLQSLSSSSLTRALDAFDRGDLREAAILWQAIATRDDTIPSVKTKREKSIAHKPLETVALDESPEAEQHKDTLEQFWRHARWVDAWDRSNTGGVRKLIARMQESISYRYAVHHIVWRPTAAGLRATFESVPLWFFETREARLRFLPTGLGYEGLELDESDWLISAGDGLMIAASIGYFCKRATLQDWLRFSEKFAMPGVLAKTPASKDSAQGVAMREAAAAFGNEWVSVIYGDDGTSAIELIQADGNPSSMPMPALIERVDRKIAALYRGADLSTMSAGNDADSTGASLQGDEADILERDDASVRSEELQRIERIVIQWTYGRNVEPLAQTRLIVQENEDQRLLLDAVRTFVDLGARLPVAGLLGRFGLSEADEGEDTLVPAAGSPIAAELVTTENAAPPVQQEDDPLFRAAGQLLALARQDDLADLDQQLRRILTLPDVDETRQALAALRDQLPDYLSASAETEDAWERLYTAAWTDGLQPPAATA